MNGKRLKLIRQANGLSLQELSEILTNYGVELGKASLSNYENGLTVPPLKTQEYMAKRLGTTVSYLNLPDWEDVDIQLFTPIEEESPKVRASMNAYIQIELEKFLRVDRQTGNYKPFERHETVHFTHKNEDRIEDYADDMRRGLGLGTMPIASVSNTLEMRGWKLMEMSDSSPFVAGYEASTRTAFIIHPSLYAIDDFRFELLKVSAHSIIQGEDPQHTEKLCERFARALLLPRTCAYYEFGDKLRAKGISIAELELTKRKYGISKRQTTNRVLELGLITRQYYDNLEDAMRLRGYPRRKQIMSENLQFYETPTTTSMRVISAVNQGLISEEEAGNILILREHNIEESGAIMMK